MFQYTAPDYDRRRETIIRSSLGLVEGQRVTAFAFGPLLVIHHEKCVLLEAKVLIQ